MTSPDAEYARLKTILLKLAEKPPAERERHARALLEGQPERLARVLKMLARHGAHPGFLEANLFPGGAGHELPLEPSPTELLKPGDRVDVFEIEQRLGSGGMGIVYQARQVKPVERRVALKLAREQLSSAEIALFERECRNQARFAHPGLAQIYAIGRWRDEQPYAAMELVQGSSITRWCEEHRAPLERRLQLFIDACLGIAHAHEKGILHRDIKPANLLVTLVNAEPTVKVIDFGISSELELSEQSGNAASAFGTPQYMSPEARLPGSVASLDTRSDVYSLGVVLCELLTSRRPVLRRTGGSGTVSEALTATETERLQNGFTRAVALDTLQALERDRQEEVAASMQLSLRALTRSLRGDLADVIAKALQHKASDRYSSARLLADDVARLLADKPVEARPSTLVYVGSKLLRRHVGMALVSSLLLVSLLGAFVALSLEARATREALAQSSAVSDFLVETIEHASPNRLANDEILLRDVMDRAAEEVNVELAGFPLAQARLLMTLGRVFGETGDYNKAIDLLAQGNDILDRVPEATPADKVQMLAELGNALRRVQQTEQAESVLLRGQAMAGSLLEDDPLLVADLANSLGNLYVVAVDYEQALAQHQRAFEIRRQNLPEGDLLIGGSANNLSTVLIYSGRNSEAEPFAQVALQVFSTELPPGHPWISVARNNLSIIFEHRGAHEESLEMRQQALQEQIDRMGAGHPDLADYYRNVSLMMRQLGRREEGLEARKTAYQLLADSIGAEAPRTLQAQRDLASWLLEEGDHAQAIKLNREALLTRLETAGPDDWAARTAAIGLAAALNLNGESERANDLIEPVLLAIREEYGTGDRRTLHAEHTYALSNSALGRADESADWLERLQQQVFAEHGPKSSHMALMAEHLAQVQLAAGRLSKAEQNALRAVELWQNRANHFAIARARHILGRVYLAQQDYFQAREQLTAALQGYRKLLPMNQQKLEAVTLDLDQAESGLLTSEQDGV